jgi:hypothetical protein
MMSRHLERITFGDTDTSRKPDKGNCYLVHYELKDGTIAEVECLVSYDWKNHWYIQFDRPLTSPVIEAMVEQFVPRGVKSVHISMKTEKEEE